MNLMKEFTKGLWKELPPFRIVLGLCPILAVTKSANDALGMGLAVVFVLVCSNILGNINSLYKIQEKSFLAGSQAKHLFKAEKESMQVKIFRIKNDMTGLNLREFQHIVDQRQ